MCARDSFSNRSRGYQYGSRPFALAVSIKLYNNALAVAPRGLPENNQFLRLGGDLHNEKESIRVGPANSERWPIAAWPGPGRIGLIELNRAPIYGDWNAGIGCRLSAVRAGKTGDSRRRTGSGCCHRAMRRRRAIGGQIAGA